MHRPSGHLILNVTLQAYNAEPHVLSATIIPDMIVLQLCLIRMLKWPAGTEKEPSHAKCIVFYKINNLVCVNFHHYL